MLKNRQKKAKEMVKKELLGSIIENDQIEEPGLD